MDADAVVTYWVGLLMVIDLSRTSGDTDASASVAGFNSSVVKACTEYQR
jgi:hypothetical protein